MRESIDTRICVVQNGIDHDHDHAATPFATSALKKKKEEEEEKRKKKRAKWVVQKKVCMFTEYSSRRGGEWIKVKVEK